MMKFRANSYDCAARIRNRIRERYLENDRFISLEEVKNIALVMPDISEEDKYIGWDMDSDILEKLRSREIQSGWFVYLPEPNARICFDKKKMEIKGSDPIIGDICVFPTELFDDLIKSIDEGFFGLMQAFACNSGRFYRPCIVKARKSGTREQRQDRKARFHRWVDLSKGVNQVVALIEFYDGHIEQVQPDRIIFCDCEEEVVE